VPTPLELLQDPVSIAVIAVYVTLLLWEAAAPARPLPAVAGWRLRGAAAFALYFFVSSYLPLVIGGWFTGLRLFDASALGTLGGALLAMLGYEAIGYAWHRAMHRSDWLFRGVHQMHHSAERLDVAGAFWFSPLDMVGWTLVSIAALSLFGLTPAATTLFVLASTLLSVFQHANLRTPRWLGYLVQRPESHSFHHARGVHAGNYANLPIFDLVFGTFHNPGSFAEQVGFFDGASARVADMLVFRDVSRP
jgi:sterol desaturase/sphingolipid hydroxylase (fatty acid hydroxylase superfamily)